MKPIRFTSHANGNLVDREIAPSTVMEAIRNPERREPGRHPREIVSREFNDPATGERMLLRAVIEEAEGEIAVVTVYKTSKINKYLKGRGA